MQGFRKGERSGIRLERGVAYGRVWGSFPSAEWNGEWPSAAMNESTPVREMSKGNKMAVRLF